MTEHLIRLRGGWECRLLGAPDSAARRLDLPVRGGLIGPGRLMLTRRFGRPRLVAADEVLLLRLDEVCGLRSVNLNGQPLDLASGTARRHEILLEGLAERNVLVLDVETAEHTSQPELADLEWGMIALVVRTVDPAQTP